MGTRGGPLDEWLSGVRVDDATAERSRTAWLARQATEEATLAGTLLELAEQGAEVVLRLRAGAGLEAEGTIAALGADVVVLDRTPTGTVLVPLGAVASVRAGGRARRVWGDRSPASATTLHDLLSAWSPERPELSVHTAGTVINGELSGVGLDVITLRHTSIDRATEVVALAAVQLVSSREALRT